MITKRVVSVLFASGVVMAAIFGNIGQARAACAPLPDIDWMISDQAKLSLVVQQRYDGNGRNILQNGISI